MRLRIAKLVFFCLCLSVAFAAADTITFEGLPLQYSDGSGHGYNYFQSVTTQGFTFSTNGQYLWYNNYENYCSPACSTDGSYTLSDLTYSSNAPLTMVAQNAAPFSLNGFDVAGTFTGIQPGFLTITGNLHSGGTINQELTLSVPQNPDPFATIALSGWDNLDSVTFSMSGGTDFLANAFAIDNVVVNEDSSTAVPEPSSLLLLGTGMAGALGAIKAKVLR